ncbi:MAG: 3-hydroxyacyl-ACP dehydratase FabZ [Clostridiales bacterium]|nr:3-hydroxyacyl-ACP dehydratase FabZ [Clostridiales bacterium]
MMNIVDINKRIKQRPPFQMIERVTELNPGESASGIKNVSINEPYFTGHFPDAPIMPGVLVIESCAQLCSLVIDGEKDDNLLYVLLKVDNFKFIKPVIPGDTLNISVKKTRAAGTLTSFEAAVCVEGSVRAKGNMTFTAIPKESVYGNSGE